MDSGLLVADTLAQAVDNNKVHCETDVLYHRQSYYVADSGFEFVCSTQCVYYTHDRSCDECESKQCKYYSTYVESAWHYSF